MENLKNKKPSIQVKAANSLFGEKRASIEIVGDIIKPVLNEKDWNVCNGVLVNKK